LDHLTPYERETVILMSDGDDVATIATHQRTVLTKLENNPAAVKVEDLTHGGSRGAKFTLPAKLVSFRRGHVQLSDADREARAERARAMGHKRM